MAVATGWMQIRKHGNAAKLVALLFLGRLVLEVPIVQEFLKFSFRFAMFYIVEQKWMIAHFS